MDMVAMIALEKLRSAGMQTNVKHEIVCGAIGPLGVIVPALVLVAFALENAIFKRFPTSAEGSAMPRSKRTLSHATLTSAPMPTVRMVRGKRGLIGRCAPFLVQEEQPFESVKSRNLPVTVATFQLGRAWKPTYVK